MKLRSVALLTVIVLLGTRAFCGIPFVVPLDEEINYETKTNVATLAIKGINEFGQLPIDQVTVASNVLNLRIVTLETATKADITTTSNALDFKIITASNFVSAAVNTASNELKAAISGIPGVDGSAYVPTVSGGATNLTIYSQTPSGTRQVRYLEAKTTVSEVVDGTQVLNIAGGPDGLIGSYQKLHGIPMPEQRASSGPHHVVTWYWSGPAQPYGVFPTLETGDKIIKVDQVGPTSAITWSVEGDASAHMQWSSLTELMNQMGGTFESGTYEMAVEQDYATSSDFTAASASLLGTINGLPAEGTMHNLSVYNVTTNLEVNLSPTIPSSYFTSMGVPVPGAMGQYVKVDGSDPYAFEQTFGGIMDHAYKFETQGGSVALVRHSDSTVMHTFTVSEWEAAFAQFRVFQTNATVSSSGTTSTASPAGPDPKTRTQFSGSNVELELYANAESDWTGIDWIASDKTTVTATIKYGNSTVVGDLQNSLFIGPRNGGDLKLVTGGYATPRFTLKDSGKIGIGTVLNPDSLFQLPGYNNGVYGALMVGADNFTWDDGAVAFGIWADSSLPQQGGGSSPRFAFIPKATDHGGAAKLIIGWNAPYGSVLDFGGDVSIYRSTDGMLGFSIYDGSSAAYNGLTFSQSKVADMTACTTVKLPAVESSGPIKNGNLYWYTAADLAGLNAGAAASAPNGSLGTTADGNLYLRTGGAWVQK